MEASFLPSERLLVVVVASSAVVIGVAKDVGEAVVKTCEAAAATTADPREGTATSYILKSVHTEEERNLHERTPLTPQPEVANGQAGALKLGV